MSASAPIAGVRLAPHWSSASRFIVCVVSRLWLGWRPSRSLPRCSSERVPCDLVITIQLLIVFSVISKSQIFHHELCNRVAKSWRTLTSWNPHELIDVGFPVANQVDQYKLWLPGMWWTERSWTEIEVFKTSECEWQILCCSVEAHWLGSSWWIFFPAGGFYHSLVFPLLLWNVIEGEIAGIGWIGGWRELRVCRPGAFSQVFRGCRKG